MFDKIILQKIKEAISLPVLDLIEIKSAFLNETDEELKALYSRMFSEEFNQLDTTYLRNLHKFNIMSMVGGPYYVCPDAKIEIRDKWSNCLQVTIDDQWAGSISFMHDNCGVDNLLIMAGLTSKMMKTEDGFKVIIQHGDKIYYESFYELKRQIYGGF